LLAYNEEKVIEKAVCKLVAVLQERVPDFEVIVINDGSRCSPGNARGRRRAKHFDRLPVTRAT
jgi:hypothetical protein